MSKNLIGGRLPAALTRRSAIASLALCSPWAATLARAAASDASVLKVAFVYVSPVGEAGWSYQHDLGRRAMLQALGERVDSTVVESVAEGPDAERVMRDLGAQGHRLIFATSFGYLEPALRVASFFPEVRFEHAGGYRSAPNLGTYNGRFYEGRYLAGMVAARASRSGVAGYVAGFPVPEVIQGINAFALGMREVNPAARVQVLWLDSWFDPPRERDAAMALINRGADVLTNHSGSPAVALAAEEKGVRFIGYTSDMRRFAPKAQLTAVLHQWGGFYTAAVRSVLDGRWKNLPVWGGIKDGFVTLAPFSVDLPADIVARVKARETEIAAGRFQPFAGRLVDNTGVQRQASGPMTDERILAMNWFVEGVLGVLPKR